MEIGLNLYSLRNQIKTEEDFRNTMLTLKQIGISFIQYSGADFLPERIKKICDYTDLPCVLTHVPQTRILEDTDALMEEHKLFGCTNIGLGALQQSTAKDKDQLFKTMEELEKVGKYMKDRGFKFFYHNHHFEFYKYSGKTILDYIIEESPDVNITLDTYWVQYGGGDIIDTIRKLKGRIGCVHLKDYMINISDEGKFEPKFAPLGDGNLNFPKIVEEMKKAGTEYFLIEQDNATDLSDPIGQIERSVKYIKENF